MHELILWAGFLGAWLLVAGPVHQAGVELGEEDFERERYADAMLASGRPDPVSPWWWLLPPVHLYLSHRRRDEWQWRFVLELDDERWEALHRYQKKAYGWVLVGAGGLLIATKETFELVEGNEWPTWLFWVLVVAGLAVSLLHAVLRARRSTEIGAERLARRTASEAG